MQRSLLLNVLTPVCQIAIIEAFAGLEDPRQLALLYYSGQSKISNVNRKLSLGKKIEIET